MRKNTIVFRVNGNRLERVGGYDPVSGEKNYSVLRFEFDEEWSSAKSVTITVFKDVKSPFNIVKNKDVGSNMVVAYLPPELQGVSGILWVGITGVLTGSDKPTLDTNMVAMPVVQGIRVSEEISTKLYLQIIEYMAKLEVMMIDEENQIMTSYIQNGAVTPQKLDREYWTKNVKLDSITDVESLFECVGFVNNGGSIAQVAVDIDFHSVRITGVCIAFGKKFTTGDTVYLINTSSGEFCKIDRYKEDNYYTYKPTKINTDIDDGIITPAKLDRKYWEFAVSTEPITDSTVLFDKVGTVHSGGSIALINVNLYSFEYNTEISGICYAVGFQNQDRQNVYLINVSDSSVWIVSRDNEGDEVVPIYRVKFNCVRKRASAYLEKCYTSLGQTITSFSELFSKIGFISIGGNIGVVKISASESETEIITDGYIDGEFLAVGSSQHDNMTVYLRDLASGDTWSVVKYNNGTFIATRIVSESIISLISKELKNKVTVYNMITIGNHESLDNFYNNGYGIVNFDVSNSSGFLPFGRYQAIRYHNPADHNGYLITNLDTGAHYKHVLGSSHCKLLFDPTVLEGLEELLSGI